jgi:Cu2+-exporting ATPase
MAITLVSLAWPGAVFFRGAWNALRTRTLTLDVPISLGLAAGGVYGVFNTLRGSGEIYFDSLSVLVFALLLGRFVQLRRQRSAADSIELLFSLTPRTARMADDGGIREVPIEAVATGMLVEVRAGDSVPVDGTIVEGDSTLDTSQLTGESRPSVVRAGDAVHAGAVNLSGRLVVRVQATGHETRIGQVMRLVEDAALRRPTIVALADRVAGGVMAAMLALSALTFAIWWPINLSRAVEHAVALLIVTCPCALGLATPLAATAAIGRGARRQILVKGGDVLERLARPGTILLDKTGTITTGRLSLVDWRGDPSVRPLAAAIERHSSHPIACALAESLGCGGGSGGAAVDVIQTVGGGIEGRIEGRSVAVGSPAFVHGLATPGADLRDTVDTFAACGHTVVLVAVDGRVVAAAALGDAIRPDAGAAIAELRRTGWRVLIRSGDHPKAVAAVARKLGIDPRDARGGMTPEDKLADVESGGHTAPVVMVGDGVNDAAALAGAGVGIAVHAGAEASLTAADVYLGRPGLAAIVELVRASRRTIRVIRLNFVAAIAYNALAAALSLTGLINPLIAAILMPASSLTVLTLSFRARTFGDR